MNRLVALALFAVLLASQVGLEAQTSPPQRLQITILDGEGALNNIKQQTAREPIVQIEDENHRPIAGVLITFTLPQSGAGGSFANGSAVFQAQTDANGQATATGLTPNHIAGRYQIQVNAKYHDLSAHSSINQTNFVGANASVAHAATRTFPLKAVLIAVAVAGAAAVAVAATHSGGSNSSSNSAATITTGTATVTAP
jgi:hypothetical protein